MTPEPLHGRVTIRDMAKQLGVSHATVSMALRNHPRVAPATRDAVHQLAARLGYRPDPVLGALAHYRQSKTQARIHAGVAWVNAWRDPEELRRFREFDAYWRGAIAEAEKSGYRLEEFRLGPDCSPARLHQILSARGVRGILLPPHREAPEWEDFPWEDYAVVRFGRSLQPLPFHLVTSDHVANAVLAFQRIQARGYRRIGFVTRQAEFVSHGHWFGAGFLAAQQLVPPDERLPIFKLDEHATEDPSAGLRDWLDRHRPEAIFTDSAQVADLLAGLGVRVPEDLGLAVTSVLDGCADSGLDQRSEEIGRCGFKLLNAMIHEGERGAPSAQRQMTLAGTWIDGTSLPVKNRE